MISRTSRSARSYLNLCFGIGYKQKAPAEQARESVDQAVKKAGQVMEESQETIVGATERARRRRTRLRERSRKRPGKEASWMVFNKKGVHR